MPYALCPMPYALCPICRIAFVAMVLCFLISFGSLTSDGLFADDTVVELTDEGTVEGVLIGILDLGEVKAGATVDASFILKNKSDRSISYNRVRPSCGCTTVEVKAETLESAKGVSMPARVAVTVPSVQARNFPISEVTLLQQDSDVPVAMIRIKATVERPFWVKEKAISVSLDKSERFEARFSFETSAKFDPKLVNVTVNDPNVSVSLNVINEKQSEIVLVGVRGQALAKRVCLVSLAYRSDDWNLTDELSIFFYDQEAIRVFPSVVELQNGKIRFKLYREQGFTKSKLVIKTDADVELITKSDPIGKSLLSVTVDIPSGIELTKLKMELGESTLLIPISKKEERP